MHDRADILEALRDDLIRQQQDAGPKELPALSRELRAVLAELEQIAVPAEGSLSDELRRKRAERLAGSDAFNAAAFRP